MKESAHGVWFLRCFYGSCAEICGWIPLPPAPCKTSLSSWCLVEGVNLMVPLQ